MSKNDITGDNIATGVPSKEYLENYDRIFNKIKDPKEAKAFLQRAGILDEEGEVKEVYGGCGRSCVDEAEIQDYNEFLDHDLSESPNLNDSSD